jgi:hypothetical protein
MKRNRKDWVEIFEALGEAFFSVLRSEAGVLWRDLWEKTLSRAFMVLAVAAVAACLSLTLVLLLVTASVQMVEAFGGYAPWQATLIVAAAMLLLVVALSAVIYFVLLKRIEDPFATIRARFDDHMEWWYERLLDSDYQIEEGKDADHES